MTERQRQILRGFDPDEPTEEFYGCFTKAEAQASLFESTRYDPKPVYLSDEQSGTRLPVVIDMARPLYIPQEIGDSTVPNWYFEGWILEPGRSGDVRRVRIYVSTMDYDTEFASDDQFIWQWIKGKGSRTLSSEPLAWHFA